jgi:hypothetical protein
MVNQTGGKLSRMRLALLFIAFMTVPAFAAIGWSTYENARFGFRGAVPSGLSAYVESGSGVGQIFGHPSSMQVLSYFGETLDGRDFGDAVETTLADLEQEGWTLSYQAVTPDWAEITAQTQAERMQVRMILLCDRESFATMALQYSVAQAADIKGVVDELEGRFSKVGC